MKIALVHDALVNRGGAERVFQTFCEMFPDAPIYTSVYLPEQTLPFYKTRNIKTTPLQKVVRNQEHLKLLFPLANYYMERTIIDSCDIIITSSTFCGKYLYARNGVELYQKHYCYCYTPFRLIWHPESYTTNYKHKIWISFNRPLFTFLRKWDYRAAQRIDQFITMTDETQNRIRANYGRDSIIIPPPIDFSKYSPGSGSDYFLLVSRLEPYKKVDLVIKAFNELGLPLKIVGTGSLFNQFRNLAKQNVDFLSVVSDEELLELYQGAIAVVFPQREDYGLVPLEANACGKPVICFGLGGIESTMIPYSDEAKEKATALFFYEQTAEGITNAIRQFADLSFDQDTLIMNAKRFDKSIFCEKIRKIIGQN